VKFGAEVDQQAGPPIQQPITAQLPIGPDRLHHLVIEHALDREPGQRTRVTALAAIAGDLAAGALQPGTMADRPGGGDRFLLAALQHHQGLGQGGSAGQDGSPLGVLDRLSSLLEQSHHLPSVAVYPFTYEGG
jgi:hypothetical protein